MGTARMSEDPANGVTDRWGQVHGIPNLFVSDGGLFPTSAAANPTLTIVALAIRQAEHMAGRMARREL
jgi:choline dehydrogenase-like flavoprotein